MNFQLSSSFRPAGDQPKAINQLVEGLEKGETAQVLLGVTGSGKTFTIANVIEKIQKPTLILTHNKTLAAQLFGEFRQFFPENAVEYFISYYDYYQPEAYLPVSDLYIEKDLSINAEIEKLRLRATSSLLSGRKDVIVVASVSCIYGIGNPEEFAQNIIRIQVKDNIDRDSLLFALVDILFSRSDKDFQPGTFRVRGDTLDVFPVYSSFAYRIIFNGNEIEHISSIEPVSCKMIKSESAISLFPKSLFITGKDVMELAMSDIKKELELQVNYLYRQGKEQEAKRLSERTSLDMEMLKELGYCSGVENYSRFFDRRKPGDRPFCLLDYFPEDFLMVVDESHATIPQVRGMYHGDRSRKQSLVEYGFRLPSALDNRPLRFDEFEIMVPQTIYISATPAKYELEKSEGVIVEQIVRPTGLLEPVVDIRPSMNQINDLMNEIQKRAASKERVLVTTLTKRMAEELCKYFDKKNISSRFLHSEIKALDRIDILRDLRLGEFDVLIGVNLLREGLDLPEVSLVAILDADKEGFLRNETSLIQTAGRAARNLNSLVILYADKLTGSIQKASDEINRRRMIQIQYNEKNNIIPQSILKTKESILEQTTIGESKSAKQIYAEPFEIKMVADPLLPYLSKDQLKKLAGTTRKKMEKAAKDWDFLSAARYRDELKEIERKIGDNF